MAAPAIGVLTAAASRFLVSQYCQVPTATTITYNLVDMAVSAIAHKLLVKDAFDVFGMPVARILGCIVAVLVTTALCGPIDLGVAITLNLTSLAVGVLTSAAASPRGAAPQLVFI